MPNTNQLEASLQKKIALLQSYRQHAEGNRNFVGIREHKGKAYFSTYPPEVQKVCWEFYNSLYLKHGYKLEADPGYARILVATATRLALDHLGLRTISRSGFHRLRAINKLKVDLGIQDEHPVNRLSISEKRRRAAKKASMQKLNLSQLSMEGI